MPRVANRVRITNALINQTKPNGSDHHVLWDSRVPGLGLQIRPSGRRIWLVRYRDGKGMSRRKCLAPRTERERPGAFTIPQARAGALLFLAELVAPVQVASVQVVPVQLEPERLELVQLEPVPLRVQLCTDAELEALRQHPCDEYVSVKELAERTGIPEAHWHRNRRLGTGPTYGQMERLVRYRWGHVCAWFEGTPVEPPRGKAQALEGPAGALLAQYQKDISNEAARSGKLVQVYGLYAELPVPMLKIGSSQDWRKRIPSIRTMSPVPLELQWLSDMHHPGLELDLHHRLACHREHGEWFRVSPTLNAVLRHAGVLEVNEHEDFCSRCGAWDAAWASHGCESCGNSLGHPEELEAGGAPSDAQKDDDGS